MPAFLLVYPVVAVADSALFNIEAQPLPSALRAFVEQSRVQLLYQYPLIKDVRSSPVHGLLDQQEALRRLLLNTNLEAVFSADNIASVRPISGSASSGASRVSSRNAKAASLDGCNQASGIDAVCVPQRQPLEEIIVTARRREESVSKTPVAVTAISGVDLQAAGVTDAVQLQYLVPGLMVSRERQGVNLSIRGITTTDTTPKGEPGISFNTDGVPVNRSEEQALALFDVQRVEVLSGPQGTLYGKSSTGGAINVVTNQPAQVEEASASVAVGNHDTKRIDAMINVPLSDILAVRAAVNANYRDGFIDLIGGVSKPNDENNISARFSVLANFSERLQARLTVTLGELNGVGYGVNGTLLRIDDKLSGEGARLGFANRFVGRVDDHFAKGRVHVDAPLGDWNLMYLGAYSHYRTDNLMPDYGYQSDGHRLWVRDDYDTTYQELRLTNETDRFEIMAGINYFYERITEDGHAWEVGPAALGSFGYDPDYSNLISLINDTTHENYSAYTHLNYTLTPRWRITAGLRGASDKTAREGTLAAGTFAGSGAAGPIPWRNAFGTICRGLDSCIGTPNNGSSSSGKLTYNMGTDYAFTQNAMGYLGIATGYKAGGFNDVDPVTNSAHEYGPEDMTAYEAGYKLRSPSGVQFDSAWYYYDYSRGQITQLLELNNDPTNQVMYTRLASMTIYGWENSLTYPLAPTAQFNFSSTLQKGRYHHHTAGATLDVDFSGKSLDRVPSVVLGMGFTNTWWLDRGGALQLRLVTRYSSSYYVTDFWAAEQYRQKSFTRSDADLTYTSRNAKYATQVFVRNLEDGIQITGGAQNYIAGVPNSARGYVSEPRFWGVRQTVKF